MNNPNIDIEDQEKTVEDKAFDLTVRKMKSKQYPTQMPKHVSEMSKFTDYGDNKLILSNTMNENWNAKI
jgi:hypothetical protein